VLGLAGGMAQASISCMSSASGGGGGSGGGKQVSSQNAGKTVAEILKGKKGSIKNAPLPPGSPTWDSILNKTWDEIDGKPGTDGTFPPIFFRQHATHLLACRYGGWPTRTRSCGFGAFPSCLPNAGAKPQRSDSNQPLRDLQLAPIHSAFRRRLHLGRRQ
jgi:hypothetical protein